MTLALLAFLACSGSKPADTSAETDADTDSDTDADSDADSDTDTDAELTGVPPDAPIPLPSFAARSETGEDRSESNLLGHPTVLWFYPAAGTYG